MKGLAKSAPMSPALAAAMSMGCCRAHSCSCWFCILMCVIYCLMFVVYLLLLTNYYVCCYSLFVAATPTPGNYFG